MPKKKKKINHKRDRKQLEWIPKQYICFFFKSLFIYNFIKKANKFSILFYLFSVFFFLFYIGYKYTFFFYFSYNEKDLQSHFPTSELVTWIKLPWLPLCHVQNQTGILFSLHLSFVTFFYQQLLLKKLEIQNFIYCSHKENNSQL